MASIPRWIWSVLPLTILTGCKTDNVVHESSQSAVADAYATCAMDAARRLDDGFSDPAKIAVGVAGGLLRPVRPACPGDRGAGAHRKQTRLRSRPDANRGTTIRDDRSPDLSKRQE